MRLGLVLYGGVSLAVYIYGVVVEIQRLLRARDERALGMPGYWDALELGGISKVDVDVIAGTSAGGINGILLARALASGADLRLVKSLWLDRGDVDELLHRLDDADPASLLSSERFEERLRDGFKTLAEAGVEHGSVEALDLFVSATHLLGSRRLFADSLSGEIPTLTHRRVFQLKRRPGYGRDDLRSIADDDGRAIPGSEREATERLVTLARATSAFPVAFEPVRIDPDDHLLEAGDEKSAWFADGGILNNKPFTEALETIFTRSADRPVRRWLFSVDPDPEQPKQRIPPGPKPGFDQVVAGAAIGIPRYQSIAHDLAALERHNATVRRVSGLVIDLERELVAPPADVAPADGRYEPLRIEAWARLIAESLLATLRPGGGEAVDLETLRGALEAGARDAIRRGTAGESDLAFERRRIYYLIKLLGMAVGPPRRSVEAGESDAQPDLARAALWEGFEAVSAALWESFGSVRLELGDIAESRLDRQAYVAAGAVVEGELERLAAARSAIAAPVLGAIDGLIVDLPRRSGAGNDDGVFPVSLVAAFDRFDLRDATLLTIEAGGGLRHRDIVNHAQISPATATATGVDSEQKLAGDALWHFGGFLDPDWRGNDLLWGRLDGAEIALRAVLAESSASEEERAAAIETVLREILAEERPEALATADGDWRAYLKAHARGGANLGAVPSDRKAGLLYRAGVILRRMLRTVSEEAEAQTPKETRTGVLRTVEKGVERVGWLLLAPRLIVRPWFRKRARETEREV